MSAWTSAGEGINAVFRACSEQPRCRERYGDIGATFRRLVQHYEENPKTVRVSVALRGAEYVMSRSMHSATEYFGSPRA